MKKFLLISIPSFMCYDCLGTNEPCQNMVNCMTNSCYEAKYKNETGDYYLQGCSMDNSTTDCNSAVMVSLLIYHIIYKLKFLLTTIYPLRKA